MRDYCLVVGVNIGILAMIDLTWLLLDAFGAIAMVPIMAVVVFVWPAFLCRTDLMREWRDWGR